MDAQGRLRRGMGMIVDTTQRIRVRTISTSSNFSWIEIRHPSTQHPITICSVYAPPASDNDHAEQFDHFIQALSQSLATHTLKRPPVIIGGDFNARMRIPPDTTMNAQGTSLKRCVNSYDLTLISPQGEPSSHDATRTVLRRDGTLQQSVIDYIFTPHSHAHHISPLKIVNIPSSSSDHNLLTTSISTNTEQIALIQPDHTDTQAYQPHAWHTHRLKNPRVKSNMILHLDDSFSEWHEQHAQTDIHTYGTLFTAQLTRSLDAILGARTRPRSKHQRTARNDWYNNSTEVREMDTKIAGIATRIRDMHKRRQPADEQTLASAHAELAAAKRTRKYVVRKAKNAFHARICSDIEECHPRYAKRFWSKLQGYYKPTDNSHAEITTITSDAGTTCLTMEDILAAFTTHATNMCSTITAPPTEPATQLPVPTIQGDGQPHSPPAIQPIPPIPPLNTQSIHRAISKLVSGASPGQLGVDKQLLHTCTASKHFTKALTHVMNRIIETKTIPDSWGSGTIHPLPKHATAHHVSDHRLITVISIFPKLLHAIIHSHIQEHLHIRNIITDTQYGFRPNRSCTDAIILLTESFMHRISQKATTTAIFIDIRKAYDTVNHKKLLHKLPYSAVHPSIVDLVRSLLQNMQRRVVHSQRASNTFSISAGVPQGSPLSPLLYILFINELTAYLRAHGIRIELRTRSPSSNVHTEFVSDFEYADDIVLLPPEHAPGGGDGTQYALDKLAAFFATWDTVINVNKCQGLQVTPPARSNALPSSQWPDERPPPRIYNTPIPTGSTYKYLGVQFGMFNKRGPAWAPTIDAAITNARNRMFQIARTISTPTPLSTSTVAAIFNAEILPLLGYASEAWGAYVTKTQSNTIDSIQTQFFRRMLSLHRTAYHSQFIMLDMGITPHELRRDDILIRAWNRLAYTWRRMTRGTNLDNITSISDITIHDSFINDIGVAEQVHESRTHYFTYLLRRWAHYKCNLQDNSQYGPSYTWFSELSKRMQRYKLHTYISEGTPIPPDVAELALIKYWHAQFQSGLSQMLAEHMHNFRDDNASLEVMSECAQAASEVASAAAISPFNDRRSSFFHRLIAPVDRTPQSDRIRAFYVRYMYLDLMAWHEKAVRQMMDIRNGTYKPRICPHCACDSPSIAHILCTCTHANAVRLRAELDHALRTDLTSTSDRGTTFSTTQQHYALTIITTQILITKLPFITCAIHLYMKSPTPKNKMKPIYISILKRILHYSYIIASSKI